MAIKTDTYETFDATNIPEQVLSGIDRIEREETPIYSSAKKLSIDTETPEWQTQALATAASNINVQGDEFTNDARTATVRVQNKTQILQKVVSVTGTNQAAAHYGYENEMPYQLGLATIELRRDCEFAITQNNPSVAAVTGTGGELGGVETWLETNVSRGSGGSSGGYSSGVTTSVTDGTQRAYTEDLFLDTMQTGWTNGARFTQVQVGAYNKRIMSTFQGRQSQVMQNGNAVSSSVDVYETDFGKVTVMKNPHQRARTALFYDMDKICILNLRPLQTGKLAKTHDSDEKYVQTEMTTKVVEGGLGVVADLTTS